MADGHHPPKPIALGDVVAEHYELLELLGSGGIASVYRVRHTSLGLDAAIKIMRVNGDRQTIREVSERFQREAEIVASLRHPNIVALHKHGFLGSAKEPYIVMELLEGIDLQVYIERYGAMDAARALPLMADCLEGIGLAHEKGIVHKDLKPANLFLRHPGQPDERLLVLDFGGASAVWDRRLTLVGEFMGTPQYLAPEYLRHHRVSPALDVYQIGLVLARLVTGVHPVPDVSPMDCARRHMAGELVLPDELMKSSLGPVIGCALSLDPAARFHDGRAFAGALKDLKKAPQVSLEVPQPEAPPLLPPEPPPLPEPPEPPPIPDSPVPSPSGPTEPPAIPRDVVPMDDVDSDVFKDWDFDGMPMGEPSVAVSKPVVVGGSEGDHPLPPLSSEPPRSQPSPDPAPSRARAGGRVGEDQVQPVVAASTTEGRPRAPRVVSERPVMSESAIAAASRLSAPIAVLDPDDPSLIPPEPPETDHRWTSWTTTAGIVVVLILLGIAVMVWLPHCDGAPLAPKPHQAPDAGAELQDVGGGDD